VKSILLSSSIGPKTKQFCFLPTKSTINFLPSIALTQTKGRNKKRGYAYTTKIV
jgi:hypothetical protein